MPQTLIQQGLNYPPTSIIHTDSSSETTETSNPELYDSLSDSPSEETTTMKITTTTTTTTTPS